MFSFPYAAKVATGFKTKCILVESALFLCQYVQNLHLIQVKYILCYIAGSTTIELSKKLINRNNFTLF